MVDVVWPLVRTVDKGRVYVELCRSAATVVEEVRGGASRLASLADSEPEGEASVRRCAETVHERTLALRPLLLDLLSIHRTAAAIGLLGTDATGGAGIPDELEVEFRIAAEAVRSTVERHHRVDETQPVFYRALRLWAQCAERVAAYAEKFAAIPCSRESGEPMHLHRQREDLQHRQSE